MSCRDKEGNSEIQQAMMNKEMGNTLWYELLELQLLPTALEIWKNMRNEKDGRVSWKQGKPKIPDNNNMEDGPRRSKIKVLRSLSCSGGECKH